MRRWRVVVAGIALALGACGTTSPSAAELEWYSEVMPENPIPRSPELDDSLWILQPLGPDTTWAIYREDDAVENMIVCVYVGPTDPDSCGPPVGQIAQTVDVGDDFMLVVFSGHDLDFDEQESALQATWRLDSGIDR